MSLTSMVVPTLVALVLTLVALVLTGAFAWYLEAREREERLVEQSVETARLLDASLEEQLHEMDSYRHDLAALLQDLDPERVREADTEQIEHR